MCNQWIKHSVQYDCDKYGEALLKYSPWSGHRNFVYDLISYISPCRIVELGSFYGCSTFTFLQAMKDLSITSELFAVDIWKKYDTFTVDDYDQDVYSFFKNIVDCEYPGENIHIMRMIFDNALPEFEDKSIDLLHIDGSHKYEDVKHDYLTWLPKMSDNGIILFHDIAHEEVNGLKLGSGDLWDEIKSKNDCTFEFPYSYGLGILFLNKYTYDKFINAFDYSIYIKDFYNDTDKVKDELRKNYFLQQQQQNYIKHLEQDKQICDDCIKKLADEVQTVKTAYEKTIDGKDKYIDELEKRLYALEGQPENGGLFKQLINNSANFIKSSAAYDLIKTHGKNTAMCKKLHILSYLDEADYDISKLDLSHVLIWGTSPRALQIKQFIENICSGKVDAFLSNDNDFINTTVESIPVFSAAEFFNEGISTTIIIGTILPGEQKEMIEMVRNSAFKGIVLTCEYFHRMCEVPKICGQASRKYDIDFNEKMKRWVENYLSEVDFWKNDVATPGSAYWNHYIERIAPKDFYCGRAMKYVTHDSIVLDVGCGLCSQYGRRWEGSILNLTGVDPLASFYNIINNQYALNNNINFDVPKVDFGMFELLSYQFGNDYCDLIIIDNALDHCIDPLISIIECLKVLKIGGVLSTFHHLDEAYKAFYSDLHQWNICINSSGDLIIWNHQNLINVKEYLEEYVDFETEFVDDFTNETPYGGVMCNMIKKKEIPENFMSLENKTRAGFILKNMMEQLSSCEYAEKLIKLMKN